MSRKGANLQKELIKEFQSIYSLLYEKKYLIEHREFMYKKESSEIEILTWSTRSPEANITFDISTDINAILDQLLQYEQFSLLFYDRSILQVEYTLKDNNIIKQRLQYIKKTNYIKTFEEIELFENKNTGVEGGSWFEEESGIPVFLRVDYDPLCHDELYHSKSHFVFSNLKDCRIPINKNITFSRFVEFILHQIYNDYSIEIDKPYDNDVEITDKERSYFHICS